MKNHYFNKDNTKHFFVFLKIKNVIQLLTDFFFSIKKYFKNRLYNNIFLKKYEINNK